LSNEDNPYTVMVMYGPNARAINPTKSETPKALFPPPVENLTARQREVLKLIVEGQSNKEIARKLKLAEGTVKIHVAALFGKLGVHRRAAVAIAAGVVAARARAR